MIPRDYITEWRAHAPWVQDFQVEQDLVISRALVAIFNHPVLAKSLAFRGGTALYKLHLKPAARYSEDIDLVQINAEPAGPIMGALRDVSDPWLGKPQWKQSEGRVTFVYRFDSEDAPPPIGSRGRSSSRTSRQSCAIRSSVATSGHCSLPGLNGTVPVLPYACARSLSNVCRARRGKARVRSGRPVGRSAWPPDPVAGACEDRTAKRLQRPRRASERKSAEVHRKYRHCMQYVGVARALADDHPLSRTAPG
ncbi:MAG: nucleotidyl transferase AbiEii/AbiGii toxin family protein [Gammaproteobacteria bacterium]